MTSQSEIAQRGKLERILIVENAFRPGVGLLIARLFRNAPEYRLNSLVIDADEITSSLAAFKPDVVILDVDSLRQANALEVAIEVRQQNPNQVVMFSSDRPTQVLVKEGLLAPLWSRAYWLNQPSRNPAHVLAEIFRAFEGSLPLNVNVLEGAVTQSSHVGRLTPQQHRVMRLMAMGASNAKIGDECNMTPKAVERAIAAASRLLDVPAASPETNHRVIAAMAYRRAVLYTDLLDLE